MENTNGTKPLDEDMLKDISGGSSLNQAQCDCPFCGNRITPIRRGAKSYCPICGKQCGGPLG